jgi:TRAP-type C4-dicarboxylate transport system permease small subunit
MQPGKLDSVQGRPVLKGFDRLVARLARIGVALAALSLLGSLALIVYSVVMRYFLNAPVPWVDEIVGYLLVACVMLAAADALRAGEHIAVDVLTERLSQRARRRTLLLGLAAVAVSASLLLVEGYHMVAFSRMVGLLSNSSLAVPMWIPQLMVPLGAWVLLLAAVAAFGIAWHGGRSTTGQGQPPSGTE